MTDRLSNLAVVAIGRNEGERLKACLRSVVGRVALVVYVDSGSSDGSVEFARGLGMEVVQIDMSVPFTAARARNAGWRCALVQAPGISAVQFVDGDCEIVTGWLPSATAVLALNPEVVAVCGRRRERYPGRSVYNHLCDLEWSTPVGETKSFGGDAMVRVAALLAAGGYRDDLIAGEEPELCVRLRAAGGRIWRLDLEMTLHDAAILRFGQWWLRCTRAGYAFAEGVRLHGDAPERHRVREYRRALGWGLGLPLLTSAAVMVTGPWGLLPALLYLVQGWRLFGAAVGNVRERALHAVFLMVGKFAEAQGLLMHLAQRARRSPAKLIEYK